VSVRIFDDQGLSVDVDLLRRLGRVVLAGEGYGDGCMVDVTLVSDCRMEEMSLVHRRRREVTDVLAFPLQVLDPKHGRPSHSANGPPLHLGDGVIAADYARGRADRSGWDYSHEMGLMVVHGLLHLMGYLHDSDSRSAVMEERERRHLAKEGLSRR